MQKFALPSEEMPDLVQETGITNCTAVFTSRLLKAAAQMRPFQMVY